MIIVNYGTAALAVDAVESVLARHHGGRSVDIHVVDNASPGDDAAVLSEAHRTRNWGARVTLHLEDTNHGFGRGNNLVLRVLIDRPHPPEFVFLLNPDARLKTETIAELADFLGDHSRAAAVGAGIDRPGIGPAVSAAFRFPSAISEFASAVQFGPLTWLTDRWTVPLPPSTTTRQVDWISGAGMLLRVDALRAVGLFDPDFFLYFEETELMHRLNRAGWEVWYCAEARIEHVAGAATGMRATKNLPLPQYWFESWRIYFFKTHGIWGARFCALMRLSGSIIHAAISVIRCRKPSYPPRFPSDFALFVLRPLFHR